MTDQYIDQFEAMGYGNFAVSQIRSVVVGLEKNYDKALQHSATKLKSATGVLAKAVEKAGGQALVTFTGAAEGDDPIGRAKDLLTRCVRYAQSRTGGDAIASKMLGGQALTTVKRRRPAKLVAVLDQAIKTIQAHKASLDEYKSWLAELTAARDAVSALDAEVRKTRAARREMTPEVQAARANWLKAYGAAKLLVEAVLREKDKLAMMPDVFDDLAEVHRVPGVTSDDAGPANGTAAAPQAAPSA